MASFGDLPLARRVSPYTIRIARDRRPSLGGGLIVACAPYHETPVRTGIAGCP